MHILLFMFLFKNKDCFVGHDDAVNKFRSYGYRAVFVYLESTAGIEVVVSHFCYWTY